MPLTVRHGRGAGAAPVWKRGPGRFARTAWPPQPAAPLPPPWPLQPVGRRPNPMENCLNSSVPFNLFDLACLAASLCGVGHLPRFWIHDSPRQADSEEQLYYSVLRLISDFEASYPKGKRPAFQYILTTTSAPPAEVNRPPFVRMRLHARAGSGKLLKCDFGK